MGERVLGLGLKLLGIALFVGPFIAAFAAHNWDFQAVVTPEQDFETIIPSEFETPQMGEFEILRFDNTVPFDPSHHYVHSWEDAEAKLENDLGQVLGHVDLGNAGSYEGHSPTKDMPEWGGCAGDSIPDYDTADPTRDCVNPNDGIAPVFEFNTPQGSFVTPLSMSVPGVVGHDPVNAVVVRSSLDLIQAAFIDAGWEFYSPDEGFFGPESHTPIGEVADAFLDIGEHQYHIRVFYGGQDSTYGDWYYIAAHYEGQNAKPVMGVKVSLKSPFDFSLRVENFAIELFCATDDQRLGQAQLDKEVVIQPKSTGTLEIVMEFTLDGFNHLLSNHVTGTSIDAPLNLRDGVAQMDALGITVTIGPRDIEGDLPFSWELGGK